MIWVSLVANVSIGFALLLVGLLLVRKASGTAGLLMAAAGALQTVATCCVNGISLAQQRPDIARGIDPRRFVEAATASGSCTDLVFVGLLAASFIVLGKSLRQAKATQP